MQTGKCLLIFFLGGISWGNAKCQINPFQDEEALVYPNFNEDIIHAKRISQITMHYFSKPDGAPISDDSIEQCYFFDSAGKITRSVCTVKSDRGGFDTIKCRYYYDNSGNITIKRTEMGNFFDTWYYKWYKDRQLQTENHIHEISVLMPDSIYKFTSQQVISADSFAYITYQKQLQQYSYNEDNKYFRKTITQYDDNKHLLSRNSQFALGGLYSQVDVTYDESGKITGYLNTGNMNGEMSQKTTIQYDSLGKVEQQGIWEHGKQSHYIEFMYDNETGLISNKLDRDEDKAIISIIRFKYEMFESKSDSTAGK